MNKLLMIIIALCVNTTFTGCGTVNSVIHNNEKHAIKKEVPVGQEFFHVKLNRIRSGATDGTVNISHEQSNLNDPLSAYIAGQDKAIELTGEKAKGLLSWVGAWLYGVGIKAKDIDDGQVTMIGDGAIASGSKIVQQIYQPLAVAVMNAADSSRNVVSNNTILAKEMVAELGKARLAEKEIELLKQQIKGASLDANSIASENARLRKELEALKSGGTTNSNDSAFPENFFTEPIKSDQNWVVKEGHGKQGDPVRILVPAKYSDLSEGNVLTVNGERFKDITYRTEPTADGKEIWRNGRREHYVGSETGGAYQGAKVVLTQSDGTVITGVISGSVGTFKDGTYWRGKVNNVSESKGDVPEKPKVDTGVIDVKIGKYDIYTQNGISRISPFLADLERQVSSDWLNDKAVNEKSPAGGDWSNILIEQPGEVRNVWQRTSIPTTLIAPPGLVTGDVKIRGKGKHSYKKGVTITDKKSIDLSDSQWLSDTKVNGRKPQVDPPAGW